MHRLATIALAAALGLALSACGASPATPGASAPTSGALPEATSGTMPEATSDSMTQPTTEGGTMSEAAQATVDQIAAAADDWYGKPVTLSGDVTQVYNTMAFSVADTGTTSGSPLLVIMPSGVTLSQGQSVEVSGTVQQLDVAQLEQDLGITLDDSLTSMAGQPVIIADQVNG